MSVDQGVLLFERLANAIGPGAALKISAFYGQGSCTLYVPENVHVINGHRLEKLIGEEAFGYLVSSFGGETIPAPRLACMDVLRRAGAIANLARYNVPPRIVAASLDLSERRVRQITEQLRLEGFAGLIDETEKEEQP